MIYQIIWTETFGIRLDNILKYLTKEFSYQSAKKYRSYLEDQLKLLEVLPHRGKEIKLLQKFTYKYLISKKNIIIYKIDEDKKEVHLLTIATANENYLNLLWLNSQKEKPAFGWPVFSWLSIYATTGRVTVVVPKSLKL